VGGKMWTATIHYINSHVHGFECMHKPSKEDALRLEKTSARSHRNIVTSEWEKCSSS